MGLHGAGQRQGWHIWRGILMVSNVLDDFAEPLAPVADRRYERA